MGGHDPSSCGDTEASPRVYHLHRLRWVVWVLSFLQTGTDHMNTRPLLNTRPLSPRLLPLLALMLLPAFASGQAPDGPQTEQTVGERVSVSGGAYWNISVPELQGMLGADRKPLLVNTHVPFQGDIAGTDVSIRYNEIADHLDQLPTDKDAAVVLYCRSGPMSVRAATTLAGLGYTRVYSLVGGFNAWGRAGLPLVNP